MKTTPKNKIELLQGTLDMLILKALQLDPMHGFGLAQRLHQISAEVFQIEMGSLYPALVRLEKNGWIRGKWGQTENNRRAKFYSLTAAGRRQLAVQQNHWELLSATINKVLSTT